MFIQTDNPFTSPLTYTGAGAYYRRPEQGINLCDRCIRCVLHIGETVTIESVWYRNAYPGDPMILAYVRGDYTDEATHVPVNELA